MKLFDTIAAVSTPRGKGGVAIIRISGADAHKIGNAVFSAACGRPVYELDAGRLCYGEIKMPTGEVVDDGLAAVFYGPRSFTGEDTVEINCHGGALVTKKVLSAVLAAGARAAEAGEFTRRAYVNGKMRLSEAEALGELLEAVSDSQLKLARSGVRGILADKIDGIYENLRRTLTSIYAAIDFPDEDLSEMSREEICEAVEDSLAEIERLSATYSTGKAINEGVLTVICGRTNAGKSSVYNRILGYDAAIVTDIEGTTRDVLKETATLGKTLLKLCDTAGLRQTEDKVESIGIERTRGEIERAELILAVFDRSRPLTEEDISLARMAAGSSAAAIALFNKSDCEGGFDMSAVESLFEHKVNISAKEGEGFSELSELIDSLFIDGEIEIGSDAVVTGARQYASLVSSSAALTSALEDLRADVPLDLCCVAVENALSLLGEVDGRELGEEIVSEIFSKFCVGK